MSTLGSVKSVPVQMGGSVPDGGVGHIVGCNRISQRSIEGIAVEKFKSCGLGITFEDIQRSLKHFHDKGVLFTAQSLISQGIFIIQNTNPQQYFPAALELKSLKISRIVYQLKPRGLTSPT
jgi:hypothetical protein